MAEKLRICLISREFVPDTAFGGIATFSLDTALMLQARGHEVTVFSQCLSRTHVIHHQGIRVHKIKVPAPFDNYRVLPPFILAYNSVVIREVLRCHRERPFDLVDAPDHLAEGLFATLFTAIPVVVRLHTPFSLIVAMGLNDYRRGFSYQLIKLAERTALHRSDVIYGPCMDLARRCQEFFSLGSIPIRVFGYPLDLSLFSPGPEGSSGGLPRILFLGRLEQRKGIETIAAAFPKLYRQHPGATLTLVGRDTPNIRGFASARRYLDVAFADAGCAAAVRFVENVDLERLPGLFQDHDIVWVPSMYDSFPLTCLEAMACGKAVITSDAGGLPEMVNHGESGLVFPVGDADALSRLTGELCDSPELRNSLGRNAREYTEAHCSVDAIYAKTMELYDLALARKIGGVA